jgi:hypothetical protein
MNGAADPHRNAGMNRYRRGSHHPSPSRRYVRVAQEARRTMRSPDPRRQEEPRKLPRPAANPCYIPAYCRPSWSHPILVSGIIGKRTSVRSFRLIPSIGRSVEGIRRCVRRRVEWANRARGGCGYNGCDGVFILWQGCRNRFGQLGELRLDRLRISGTVMQRASGTVMLRASGTVTQRASGTVMLRASGTVTLRASGTVTLRTTETVGIPKPRLRLKWPSRHNVRKSTPTKTDSRI